MRLISTLMLLASFLASSFLVAEEDLFLPAEPIYNTKYSERFLLQDIVPDKERIQFKGYYLLKDESIVFYVEVDKKCLTAKLNQANTQNGFLITNFDESKNTITVTDLFVNKTLTLRLGEILLKNDSAKITILDSKNNQQIFFNAIYSTIQFGADESLKLTNFNLENNSATFIYIKDKNTPIMFSTRRQ